MKKRIRKKFWKTVIEWHYWNHNGDVPRIMRMSKRKFRKRCEWSNKVERRLGPAISNITRLMSEFYTLSNEMLNQPF